MSYARKIVLSSQTTEVIRHSFLDFQSSLGTFGASPDPVAIL
jgi:hypothetical protein